MNTSPPRTAAPLGQLRRVAGVACALVLVLTAGCAATRQQASTGEYIDDSVITTKVKAAVFDDPTLTSAEINVETFKGAVQLSGFVGSYAEINRAVVLARGVEGVTAVTNDMKVKGQ